MTRKLTEVDTAREVNSGIQIKKLLANLDNDEMQTHKIVLE